MSNKIQKSYKTNEAVKIDQTSDKKVDKKSVKRTPDKDANTKSKV